MTWWGSQPFNFCAEYIMEVEQLRVLCCRGITLIPRMVPLQQALNKLDEASSEEDDCSQDIMKSMIKDADWAKSEIENGFPRLRAHSLVSIWSALDNLTENVLTAFIKNDPTIKQKDIFEKIKIGLEEYEGLDMDGKATYLAKAIQRSLNTPTKRGVDRFQGVFKLLGVSAKITRETRNILFEMSCLRNAIVHKAGCVDQKLATECPGLNLTIGDTLVITPEAYTNYLSTSMNYLTDVIKALTSIKEDILQRSSAQSAT